MSKYEPISSMPTCGNCKYLDQSVVLTSFPAQAQCTLFHKYVFVTRKICLDDQQKEIKNRGIV